ncbi:MAG: hypothetical protein U5K30_05855 [Acidimicrobiales bacterium]|nr:hypothetical protein [Acidimicrobiales bacterium]
MRVPVGVVLAAPEERHAAGPDEAAVQDVVVVVLDLRSPGALVEPRLRAFGLHGTGAEHRRRDAVELRRLVELDERVRVLPVTTGAVATVDESHVDVGMVDQGVGEGHAHRARTHHQVVGLQGAHRHAAPPPASWMSCSPRYNAPTAVADASLQDIAEVAAVSEMTVERIIERRETE